MKRFVALCALSALFGCGGESGQPPETAVSDSQPAPVEMATPPRSLAAILDSMPDEVKARYQYRRPQQTLEFFGIEPGMTVVEALPGGGWYSKLLLPHLGERGLLIGADYPYDMFAMFPNMTEERLAGKRTWVADWTAGAEDWRQEGDASVAAFQMAALPESMVGTADAVLFVRALHNLARYEGRGGFLTTAINDMYRMLKPGGIVGIVQHHAREDTPDEWADGNAGYLKESFVIEQMEAGGFEFVESSDLNANEKDQPTVEDVVWRLPPSLSGGADDPELAARMREIGESNRMTLKFRKPAS